MFRYVMTFASELFIALSIATGIAFLLAMMSKGSVFVSEWVIYTTCLIVGIIFIAEVYLRRMGSKESVLKLGVFTLLVQIIVLFVFGYFGVDGLPTQNDFDNDRLHDFYHSLQTIVSYVPLAFSAFAVGLSIMVLVPEIQKMKRKRQTGGLPVT